LAERLQTGDVVERYRVESVLGEGGVAVVYRVRHTSLGTLHALKVLELDHPRLRERLLQEGRLQATLRHPNLLPVSDVLDVQGAPGLLMPFVGGGTLADLLTGGPLAIPEAERLFRAVVAGVAYAHDQGMVHRDLKPENILLEEDGQALVADFGIARCLHGEGGQSHTRAGVAMGTPAYMPPEQVRDARSADHRADIYALGVILYEMLSGRPPFAGQDPVAIVSRVEAGDYPPLAQTEDPVGQGLEQAVTSCLAPQPNSRPQSCDELLGLLDGEGPAGGRIQLGDTWMEQDPVAGGADEEPEPPQTHRGRHVAVRVLVTDPAGLGQVVELLVEAWPGDGSVEAPPGVERDTRLAAQLAVAVGLGPQARQWSMRWGGRDPGLRLHGSSVGLGLAIAAAALGRGKSLPSDVAFTGGVDLDGRVARVGGLAAKAAAAREAGLSRVFVPQGEPLSPVEGLDISPVANLAEALDLSGLTTPRWKGRWRYAAVLLPVLLALTDLGSHIDPLLQYPLLRWTRGVLPVESTVVVAMEPQADLRILRSEHPAVLRGLADAGATAIYWDVAMSAESPDDAAIAAAVTELKEAGVSVVMPVRFHEGIGQPPGTPELAAAVRPGLVELQRDLTLGWVRRAPLRRRPLEGPPVYHAAVEALRAHLHAVDSPRVEADELVVGGTRNAIWAEQIYLHPVGEVPRVAYDEPASWSAVRGKVAVVGVYGGVQDLLRTPEGSRYGVEISAGLVETLVQQASLRVASPEKNALLALLTVLATAGLARVLRRRAALVALTVPAAALGLAALLASTGMLLALLPLVVAGVVGMYLAKERP
jgi:serine/threonine-protein kinase